MPQEYVLYVDDSGTKDYPTPTNPIKASGSGCSRYFVWGAVLLTTDERDALAYSIGQLKTEVFGTASVEIKSNWLRIPKEREKRYLIPHELENWQLDDFVERYYEIVISIACQFVAIVVDKEHMIKKYRNPYDPAHLAYEYLLNRVQREMETTSRDAICYVNMDSLDSTSPVGVAYAKMFKQQHEDLKTKGSQLLEAGPYSRIKGDLRLIDSAHDHLIQVADIAAYNVLRQFRDYGESWEDTTLSILPEYEYFTRLLPKFRCGPDNRIQGYGVVKVPLIRRVMWGI